jgi:hypothetical protein
MFACTGIWATVVTLASVLCVRAGNDAVAATNVPAVLAFLYIWPLAFAAAYSFKGRISEGARRLLRNFLRLNMIASLMGTVVAIVLIAQTHGGSLGYAKGHAVIACLCHVATLAWLFHYGNQEEA